MTQKIPTMDELIVEMSERITHSLIKSVKISEIVNESPMNDEIKRKGLLASAMHHYFDTFLELIINYEEAMKKQYTLNELRDIYFEILKGVNFDEICLLKPKTPSVHN